MILCLTGQSCPEQTAVAEQLAARYGYTILPADDPAALPDRLRQTPGDYVITGGSDPALRAALRGEFDVLFADLSAGETVSGTEWSDVNMTLSPTELSPEDAADKIAAYTAEPLAATLFASELDAFRRAIDRAVTSDRVTALFSDLDGLPFMDRYKEAFLRYCTGGKRIRAYLVKLGYELSGSAADERILAPALSCELFQASVLIHDDIIDQSTVRRNYPTMHIMLGGDHSAVSEAICVGDLGIFLSQDILACSGFGRDAILQALQHQNKIYKLTIAGEIKDIELGDAPSYTLEDIIRMYELKTSWYTIIGPLQLGAILAGAPAELLDQIRRAGTAMGIAFQIKDDVMGVFGEADVIGKSNLSDVHEGKKTVLTEHFSRTAPAGARAEFETLYGSKEAGPDELARIRALLRDAGSFDHAEALCDRYIEEAGSVIGSMKISPYYKNILVGFLQYLSKRKY